MNRFVLIGSFSEWPIHYIETVHTAHVNEQIHKNDSPIGFPVLYYAFYLVMEMEMNVFDNVIKLFSHSKPSCVCKFGSD